MTEEFYAKLRNGFSNGHMEKYTLEEAFRFLADLQRTCPPTIFGPMNVQPVEITKDFGENSLDTGADEGIESPFKIDMSPVVISPTKMSSAEMSPVEASLVETSPAKTSPARMSPAKTSPIRMSPAKMGSNPRLTGNMPRLQSNYNGSKSNAPQIITVRASLDNADSDEEESIADSNTDNANPQSSTIGAASKMIKATPCSLLPGSRASFEQSLRSSVAEDEKTPVNALEKGRLLLVKNPKTTLLRGEKSPPLPLDELLKDICGFLNAYRISDGRIYIGVNPQTELIEGFHMSRKERDFFRQGFDRVYNGAIKPLVLLEQVKIKFREVTQNGKLLEDLKVIEIVIKNSSPRTTSYIVATGKHKDVSFLRVGRQTEVLTCDAWRKYIAKQDETR